MEANTPPGDVVPASGAEPDVNDNVVVLDAILDVTVADGQDPTVGDPLTLTVDEDDLPGGTDSDPEPAGDRINDGTLEFTAGSDDLTDFAFSTDLSSLVTNVDGIIGDDVTWIRNSDTEIVGQIGGFDAIRLTLTAPASITAGATDTVSIEVELLEAFPHPDANGQNIIDSSEEHTSALTSLMRNSYDV